MRNLSLDLVEWAEDGETVQHVRAWICNVELNWHGIGGRIQSKREFELLATIQKAVNELATLP